MKITFIGAGNVAWHLAKRLHKKGFSIIQIFSRDIQNALAITKKTGGQAVNNLEVITPEADLYILAVKDDIIGKIAQLLTEQPFFSSKLVVHTSGAVSMDILAPYFEQYGVFYPLQTLTKGRKVKFSKIPLCINTNSEHSKKTLLEIGKKISKKVGLVSDEERAVLHIAAVFTNNFANHLFYIGHQILEKEQIDFSYLYPLLEETVYKVKDKSPYEMQTGPAKRGDQATITKHLAYLSKFPEYSNLYELLTKSITNAYRR